MPILALNLLFLISCKNKSDEHENPDINKGATNATNDWEHKSVSMVDVNFNDGFEENGYGAIDSVLIQKLFTEVFSGNLKVVKDNAERTPLSKSEVIIELKNSYTKINTDTSKKHFFIDADGEKIDMRDIIQILTKDKMQLQEPGYNLIRETQEIAIVAQTYDQQGIERGKRILFWILLKEDKNV